MKYRTYGILRENAYKADKLDEIEYIFQSRDKNAVADFLRENNADDESFCIEIFYTDDEGDFIEGSDYDTPSNFIKNLALR